MKWKEKSERFVLFFDILGFKELVARQSHEDIILKLTSLSDRLIAMPTDIATQWVAYKIDKDQVKSITFSDSIIIFSKGNTEKDGLAILAAAHGIYALALGKGIPLKGALSYGVISLDFKKSLFFGQPIIDAYLLHEDLHLLSVIVDHNAEIKLRQLSGNTPIIVKRLKMVSVPMKYGKVLHCLVPPGPKILHLTTRALTKMYSTVSGKPRIYLDNTMIFLKSLKAYGK